MFRSCLAVVIFIAALAILGAAGYFLYDTSENANFDRSSVDPSRFAE